MFAWWRRFQRERAGYRDFLALPEDRRRVVFYSEGKGYWTHFQSVFNALRDEYDEHVLYVTSAEDDPVLQQPQEGMTAFYIGEGSIRTLFFAGLKAKVVLMTMPDLHTYQIKRSPHDVHYIYLHHSIVSTHMIYRPAAFDHFDTIFCVGPHHVEEIRAREKMSGLPEKILIEHGYGRLDSILKDNMAGPLTHDANVPAQILIAPSWGDNGLIERHGIDVVKPFIDAGYRVVLRPHPRTRKLSEHVLNTIAEYFADESLFRLDEDTDGRNSLLNSDLMVSDWSGAALEFAMGLERPVLFVDVPRKIHNPDYMDLGIEPLEAIIRTEIGRVVPENKLCTLGDEAGDLLSSNIEWQESIIKSRQKWVYNLGESGVRAARYIRSLL